jgi:hypothetical protein
MEPDEILKKAWAAVQAAGLPESMQETAFREAVALLKGETGDQDSTAAQTSRAGAQAKKTAPKTTKRKKPDSTAGAGTTSTPDEATFFSQLSHESGVAEADLRDILSLGSNGAVHVTPATRVLGTNRAEQARTVTALVAAAHGIGLGETPISAEAVRQEVQRKHCFDTGNYAKTVIGRLRGVNYGGSRAEMVLTSRWVDDFTAAVNQAHGRAGTEE